MSVIRGQGAYKCLRCLTRGRIKFVYGAVPFSDLATGVKTGLPTVPMNPEG